MPEHDRSLEERAALKIADRHDIDPETIRYCMECGRTIILTKNSFNPDPRQGKAFCTCESYGPPMVIPRGSEDA